MGGLDRYALKSLADWRDYFDGLEAQMGIRAFDYEAAAMRSGDTNSVISDKAMGAARKHAEIERALYRLPVEALALVRLTCEQPARVAWGIFGAAGLGNAADLTTAAREAHGRARSTRSVQAFLDRLAAKLTRGHGVHEDRLLRERITSDVEGLILRVHTQYVKARQA